MYCVYIMTNKYHTVLYIGVTNNIEARVSEHRNKHNPTSFTSRYRCFHLVYFEEYESIVEAIEREKQLKKKK